MVALAEWATGSPASQEVVGSSLGRMRVETRHCEYLFGTLCFFFRPANPPGDLFFLSFGFPHPPCVLVGVGRPETGAGAPITQHVVTWPPATRTAAPVWGGETEMARWPTNISPFYLGGPIWAAKNFTAFWPPKHFCTQVGPDFGGP